MYGQQYFSRKSWELPIAIHRFSIERMVDISCGKPKLKLRKITKPIRDTMETLCFQSFVLKIYGNPRVSRVPLVGFAIFCVFSLCFSSFLNLVPSSRPSKSTLREIKKFRNSLRLSRLPEKLRNLRLSGQSGIS